MLQPGGVLYFNKAGGAHHSTVCCFVRKPGQQRLFVLVCHHSVDGSVDNTAYTDVACQVPVGTVADLGAGDGADDFALVEVDEPSTLTRDNFVVATTRTPLRAGGPQITNRPVFFPGSMSRAHIDMAHPGTTRRPQSAMATRGTEPHRYSISGGNNQRFTCRRGDSGTPVFEDNGVLTGMYHMGNGDRAGGAGSAGLVIDIQYIFLQLGVQLATWDDRNLWMATRIQQEVGDDGVVWNTV